MEAWKGEKSKRIKTVKGVGKVRISEVEEVRGGVRRTRSRKSSKRIRSMRRIVLASASVIIVILNTIRTISKWHRCRWWWWWLLVLLLVLEDVRTSQYIHINGVHQVRLPKQRESSCVDEGAPQPHSAPASSTLPTFLLLLLSAFVIVISIFFMHLILTSKYQYFICSIKRNIVRSLKYTQQHLQVQNCKSSSLLQKISLRSSIHPQTNVSLGSSVSFTFFSYLVIFPLLSHPLPRPFVLALLHLFVCHSLSHVTWWLALILHSVDCFP